jgi:CheY-like chemotaxis protein
LRPEAVLLDIGLPGMDGYEVCQRIRQTPTHAGVLLIAVTGYSSQADIQRAMAAGFDGHLAKPATPGQIAEALLRHDRRRSQ